jgi:hypothetical protein
MRHIYTSLIIVQSKALITTKSNKIFSGQQPRELVERQVNRRFENHLCSRHQRYWIRLFWWEHRKFLGFFIIVSCCFTCQRYLVLSNAIQHVENSLEQEINPRILENRGIFDSPKFCYLPKKIFDLWN